MVNQSSSKKGVFTIQNRLHHGKPMIPDKMMEPSKGMKHALVVIGAPIFGPTTSKGGECNTADATGERRRRLIVNPLDTYEPNDRAESHGRGKDDHIPVDWIACHDDGSLEKENAKPVATKFGLPPPSIKESLLPVESSLGSGKNITFPDWMTVGNGIHKLPLMPRESRPPCLKALSKRNGIALSCESSPAYAKSLPVRAPIVGLTPAIALDSARSSKPLFISGGPGWGKNINLPARMTDGDSSMRTLHGAVKKSSPRMAETTHLPSYPTRSAIIPHTHPELLPYSNVREELDGTKVHLYDGDDFGMLLPPLMSCQAVENWLASTGSTPLESVKEEPILNETEKTNLNKSQGIAAEEKFDFLQVSQSSLKGFMKLTSWSNKRFEK